VADRNYAAELMTASNAGPPAREPTYAERIANFFRPWTPEDRARVAAVMPPDLAPTQIVKGMVGGAADLAMQANQAMPWGGNYPQAIGIDPQSGTIDPSVMVPFAQNVAGLAATGSLAAPAVRNATGMGIRAYHGSPHDFDRFSMDKIGTGEGAQAYGHGLYFAENEGVARGYRDALSPRRQWNMAPEDIPVELADLGFDPAAIKMAQDTLANVGNDGFQAVDALDGLAANTGNPVAKEAASVIRSFHRNVKQGGKMYEVDINASPDEFLDWDKPLSEQSPAVQDAVSELFKGNDEINSILPQATGEEITRNLLPMVGVGRGGYDTAHDMISEALHNRGIKGIRYKDAGSRAAEGGTSNYVVFDDNTINILKKYGIAGLTAGGAGAAMLGGASDPASAAAPSYSTGGRF